MASIDGLVSGLDTANVIRQLMSVERMPQTRLKSDQASTNRVAGAYRTLNAQFLSLKAAAESFATGNAWGAAKAISSDTTRVAVTASPGAAAGSLSFVVKRLATASSFASSGTVASETTAVATGPVLLSKGAAALGISDLDHGAALSYGAHTLTVTQASSAAVKTGSSALAASTKIQTGLNDTLIASVNGTARTFTLAAGTYTAEALAAEVGRLSGGTLTGGVGSAGELTLTTLGEGSAASIQVTGGTAAADLRLGADTTAIKGKDGILVLDGNASQQAIVTDVRAGRSVTVTDGTDSIAVTLAGGLRLGEATAHNVDAPANATLAQLTDAINRAGAGVTASAVQVAPGAHRLQLASTTTGASSAIAVNKDAFLNGTLGSLTQLSAGQDALITIGSGAGAYDVTRSSNTFSDLLKGTSLTLTKADPAVTVTVDVTSDNVAVADAFGKLIETVNKALADLKKSSAVNPETKAASLLTGDSLVRSLQRDLITAVGNGNADLGVSIARDGTVTFDRAKFTTALEADPAAVRARLSGTPGSAGPPAVAGVPGVAERLLKAADDASRSQTAAGGPGRLTSAIKGREDAARGYDRQIASWDTRLALREAALQKKFAGLETALGKLQQQSSWLAGQLAGLPRGGSR